ncbi:phosphatase PAP2 family protein [Nocardia blacklockiae]|uniref:phosphatase PAP2 family protein n=1 Tax=Nocardia blacklockiae TaxID=480036 RepID=UPI0018940C79|nr:phosphatase PAP2 family protein [Nocardia blacklockiae]MBF6175836.1 phosphatase PAP2 family protein [Nocardia blacklockiae]
MAESSTHSPAEIASHRAHPVLRNVVRYGYLVALVATIAAGGLPASRLYEAAWILAGIAAFTIDRPWRDHLRMLADWLPLIGALLVYDYTRDFADKLGMPLRMDELVAADRWMFHGTVPTVWLQEHLAADGQPWWTPLVGLVYTTHFIVPWLVAAIFYVYSRPLWTRYMRRVLLLSYLALVTYILVPAAPPWYASREGAIDAEVRRVSGFGLGVVSPDTSAEWLESHGNYVAALPSLHAGFALLVSVTLWPLARRWWLRVPLVAFPAAMAFTLVYGGEHYVFDILLGFAYVAVTVVLARLWERRRSAPATAAEEEPAAVGLVSRS